MLRRCALVGIFALTDSTSYACNSVYKKEKRPILERIVELIFLICALIAILAVALIAIYIICTGMPIFKVVGVKSFLLNPNWDPANGEFGILSMILSSIIVTIGSVLVGAPIAVLTSVFLVELSPPIIARSFTILIDLLAGIPSIIFGLVGSVIIVPFFARIEEIIFANSTTHRYTGGANLLSAILVLAIMVLPTMIKVSSTSLHAVSIGIKSSSLSLGATKIDTIFKVCIPSARAGILSGIVLGIGRAIGEAMAIILVSGNVVNLPLPFNAVRFLTTGIVAEFSYSSGIHRQALLGIGLVLFIFIMAINLLLHITLKKGKSNA